MRFYLVQHAEAKRKEEDPERALTDRGREEARRVAAFVTRHADVAVARILHSGKTRARQTAEIFAEALRPSRGIAQREGLAPLDEPLVGARELAEAEENLMLVGHLPHLARLAGLLLCGSTERGPVAFRMGGVVALRRDEEGMWALRWALVPDVVP